MDRNKCYAGIDYFRFAASLLVIAIHTSPLSSWSETGDFIFTRIFARVAVPFFFMTSGFFLISRYTYNEEKLASFEKKTAVMYGLSMLLYLPVNIYNGYFKMDFLLPNILKDIFFDGTLYHLWYLPASMIGAGIAWHLVKMGYKKALAISSALYLAGLFGDSYYGIISRVPGCADFYGLLFQLSDYTRNGVFFAPVFFVMGGCIADRGCRMALRERAYGLAAGFALLFAEAMVLHRFGIQRHDSMYVFLLPCAYVLFCALLQLEGKRNKNMRTAAMLIYIIHPMAIIGIRLLAKLLHLQKVLVENHMAHYIAVCFASVLASTAITAIWNGRKPKRAKHDSRTERAYIEIDLGNLEHNVRELKKVMPPKCELMAVVKAGAYGHGAFAVSTHLDKIGVKAFAVATIDEGIALRKYGIRGDILILGYTGIRRAAELKKYGLMQTLVDFDYANALNRQGIAVKAHIKIDTGMHRLGIDSADCSKVKRIFGMRNIEVCGIFTHLCCADSLRQEDVSFTNTQIARFYSLVDDLKNSGIAIPKLHIQSSYGLMNYPELSCDYVRAGIALYGVLSYPASKGSTLAEPDLRPVLSLKSKVVSVRSVKKGDSVGYGRCFTAERDSRIAILPIGYGDGYPRSLSCGNGSVRIRHHLVPVAGRVCMDQLAIDITDAPDVMAGDSATLIGRETYGALSAPAVADGAGSISNELLCRMGSRLPVVVKHEP